MPTKLPSRQRSGYTLRLGRAERRLLEAGAAKRTERLSEYLRRTATEAARRDLSTEPATPSQS